MEISKDRIVFSPAEEHTMRSTIAKTVTIGQEAK
jgi:hypothetical protein